MHYQSDSDASAHFWRPQDAEVLTDIHEESGPPVKLPNATTMNDNKVGYLSFSKVLYEKAKKVRILSDLESSSLISLSQLTDDGCKTTLAHDKIIVKNNNKVILQGTQNRLDDLI